MQFDATWVFRSVDRLQVLRQFEFAGVQSRDEQLRLDVKLRVNVARVALFFPRHVSSLAHPSFLQVDGCMGVHVIYIRRKTLL